MSRKLAGLAVSAALLIGPGVSALRSQEGEVRSVDDPRPLSAAIKIAEERCHCPITYEDPKWGSKDVIDVSGSVWHRSDVRPQVPKGGRFTFSLDAGLVSHSRPQIHASIEQLVRAFEGSGTGPGHFRVISDDAVIHVVPRDGSILDAPVMISSGTRPVADVVVTILKQVGDAIGIRVGLATFPNNLLKKPLAVDTRRQSARQALASALLSTGRPLSWRLYYDIGMGQYYLGIHFVP